MAISKLYLGDCIDILKNIPDNSIDSICCDPPYGLSFMGKTWDYDVPKVEIWQECLRILKPGGHLLSFAGTRTYHRIAVKIEDAGFEIRDMVEWVYGSGFPKSLNIGKAVDKMRNKNFDGVRSFLKTEIEKSGFTHNQLLEKLGLKQGSGLITHWTTTNKESYQILPSVKQWNNLKLILGFSDEFDNDITEHEREIVGTKKSLALPISQELKGWGEKQEYNITIPATDEAKQWEGWGTALKPAHEPICMARKPLSEKTVAENVLKWGTGGINIDESRVEAPDGNTTARKKVEVKDTPTPFGKGYIMGGNGSELGRFPANLLHDNSEEVRACFPETKTGKAIRSKSGGKTFGGENVKPAMNDLGYEDSGGNASRFFKSIIYQAKASKKDRGDENKHPTVKPIALMEYLITMITPKGGTVLDPFMGSGTTGVACKNLERDFIGMELDKEYYEIAKKRIDDLD